MQALNPRLAGSLPRMQRLPEPGALAGEVRSWVLLDDELGPAAAPDRIGGLEGFAAFLEVRAQGVAGLAGLGHGGVAAAAHDERSGVPCTMSSASSAVPASTSQPPGSPDRATAKVSTTPKGLPG